MINPLGPKTPKTEFDKYYSYLIVYIIFVHVRFINGPWSYLGTNNDNRPTNDNGSQLLRLSQECKHYVMNSIFHTTTAHLHMGEVVFYALE